MGRRVERRRRKRRNHLIIGTSAAVILFLIFTGFLHSRTMWKVSSAEAEKQQADKPDKKPIKPVESDVVISAAGDCTIGTDTAFGYANTFPYILKKNNNDYSYFFKNTNEIFKNDDISFVNLETTFTNAEIRAKKEYVFKAPPEQAEILKSGGIDAVNISNNHTFDYLEQGYEDTKTALTEKNISYFGNGTIFIKEINGTKLGFLGYTAFSDSNNLRAGLKKDIEELKKQNCIVIVSFHWGVEHSYSPNNLQIQLAHFAIDSGADFVAGHHPHVVQGIEQYKNKIICYSLGNFCFGGNLNPSDKDTFIARVIFKTEDQKLKSIGFKVIPVKISSVDYVNDYCPTPMTGTVKDLFLTKLNNLSPNAGFIVSDEYHYIEQ